MTTRTRLAQSAMPHTPKRTAGHGAGLSQRPYARSHPAIPARARRKTLMRKYQVAALMPDGSVDHQELVAPANRSFEAAFAGFAHGTMIATEHGPCAIEDLQPGMRAITGDGALRPVCWIGRMTLVPSAPVEDRGLLRMTRILADSFGLARPMPDLLLGHAARLLRSPAPLREIAGQTGFLTPARAFLDGENVIEITPPSPVALFHVALDRHAIIRAAGLEVESFHPGVALLRNMGHNARALFLSLFAHIEGEDDFGPLSHPHAALSTLENLDLDYGPSPGW